MSNEASREAFESWCAASNQKYHPTDDGLSNRQDWQTWQASRKALEAEQAALQAALQAAPQESAAPVCNVCAVRLGDLHTAHTRCGCPFRVALFDCNYKSEAPESANAELLEIVHLVVWNKGVIPDALMDAAIAAIAKVTGETQ